MRLCRYFLTLILATTLFVACNKEDNVTIPSMKLETSDISFDVSASSETIQLLANRAWRAEYDADWISVEPSSGEASNEIQNVVISVLSNSAYDRTAEVKFTMTYDYRTVIVYQKGDAGNQEDMIIYYNDFDKETATNTYGSGTSWPYLDQFEGWKNETGSGVANVTYAFNGLSARNNSNSNGSYSDYAGSGVNNLFFGSNGYLNIKDIDITGKGVNYTLTFGTEKYLTNAPDNTFNPSEFHVYVSEDNTKWVELSYSFANGLKNGRWDIANVTFTVPEGTTTLNFYIKSDLASAHRLDDFKVEATINSGTPIDFSQGIDIDGTGGGGGGGDTDGDVVYFNNFDKTAATNTYGTGNSWPYLDQFDGWKNETGSGAANVTYTTANVSARANSSSNGTYSDYAGSGTNNLFFGANNLFKIEGITISDTKFKLSFGSEKYLSSGSSTFNPSEFHVYISNDNTKWVELSYSFANGFKDGRWDEATCVFSVPTGTNSIYFRITADVASAYRLDDFKVTVADDNATATPIDFSQGVDLDGGTGTGGDDNDKNIVYKKVNTITSGKSYIIVTPSGKMAQAIASSKNFGYLYVEDVTYADEIKLSSDANEFVIAGNSQNGYTITQKDGRAFYMTGTYTSFNVTASPSSGHLWTITPNNDQTMVIKNISNGKWIQYSAQHTSYGAYDSATGENPVLFERADSGSSTGGGGDDNGDDNGDATTINLNSSAATWSASTDSEYGSGYTCTVGNIAISYYKHASSSNPIEPSSDHIRIYKSSVIVLKTTDGKKIKKVEFEATASNYCKDLTVLTANNAVASASGTKITWSGSVDTFVGQAAQAQVRVKSVSVTTE